MKKIVYASLLGAVIFFSFIYGSSLNRAIPAATTSVVKTESASPSTGSRWEYCAVSRSGYTGSSRGGQFWISYFKATGVEIVEVEEKVSEQQGTQLARAISKLGEEGWEMVGQGELPVNAGKNGAIYFKRLKP